jgi:hypothetical protein
LLETDAEDDGVEMMPSWCRQVNGRNCGISWVNCAVLCVIDDWKGQFWGLRCCLKNCAVYSVFPSGMTSHSKIAQFNWECISPFNHGTRCWWGVNVTPVAVPPKPSTFSKRLSGSQSRSGRFGDEEKYFCENSRTEGREHGSCVLQACSVNRMTIVTAVLQNARQCSSIGR